MLLLIAALLVELRTAFRLVESAGGVYWYVTTHEVFFGCLEFVPIVLAVVPLVYLGWTTGLAMKRSKALLKAGQPLGSETRQEENDAAVSAI